MTTASGTLKVGEANAACSDLQRRTRGSTGFFYLLLGALMAVGAAIGWLLVKYQHAPSLVASGRTGRLPGLPGLRAPTALARFRGKFAERGEALEYPMRIEIDPQALIYTVGGVKQIAEWPCIAELFFSKGYWIFMGQGSFFFAPAHFFASEDEQRAFIRDALSYMSAEAVERSTEAVAFGEGRRFSLRLRRVAAPVAGARERAPYSSTKWGFPDASFTSRHARRRCRVRRFQRTAGSVWARPAAHPGFGALLDAFATRSSRVLRKQRRASARALG